MTDWTPPTIHRPAINNPVCMTCGVVLIEDLIDTHIEWHRALHERDAAVQISVDGASKLLERVRREVSAE